MSATFACPHCDQTYPVKPVLIGKVVRCTACKNPFRLREDGTAEAVVIPTETAPTPSATEAAKPAAVRRAASDAAKAADIKARMEEARKSMAADLSQAAGKALQSSAVKAEETTSEKRPSTRMTAVAGDTGKHRPGPAILTGEGEREAANQRQWLLGGLAALVLAVAAGWLLTLDGPRTSAIEAFLDVVPAEQNLYGQRDVAISNRGWLAASSGAVAPFIDLGDIRWGRTLTITPASYGVAVARLADQALVPGTSLWVAPKDLARATELVAAPGTEPPDRRLATARLAVRPWSAIAKDLGNAGLDETAIEALHLLLTLPPSPGATDLGAGLKAGTATYELQTLRGSQGMVLQDLGGSYRTRSLAWEGVLLRQPGGPWRFLRLAPATP